MTAPITCNGLGAYMIEGNQGMSHEPRQTIYTFKASVYRYKTSDTCALEIKAITAKTFEVYKDGGLEEAFERAKNLRRICFLDTSGTAETKRLYVEEYCELPKDITHVCLDIVQGIRIPIRIVRLDWDHMRPYYKALAKHLGMGGCTIL